MIKFLVTLLLTAGATHAQTYIAKADAGIDQPAAIQSAFNKQDTKTVLINASAIVIKETVNIPLRKTLKIEPGYKLTGNRAINGGSIDAGYHSQITAKKTPLLVQGNYVFEHSYFSGPVVKK